MTCGAECFAGGGFPWGLAFLETAYLKPGGKQPEVMASMRATVAQGKLRRSFGAVQLAERLEAR